ncbi:hypothetical protein [Frigidibacter mobilis]|uniref:DUF2029 domain-containing protein n=1 Tax=Frigidibacter mobilis TaxID=1335048 RepID=A0A159Z633_9RHOB|nr:hypothetical protein [Frigidibacter mobilis]AMY70765.1 hypothetical protein AKL17_3541 [Frigidibacter mobilis]
MGIRQGSWRLAAFLLAVVAVMGGLALARGGLYIAKHEGDTLHLADMVLRMVRGQVPHLDYVTPIGILAVAPVAGLVALGAGLGHALILAQIVLGLLLVPAILRAGTSRMQGSWPWVLGALVLVFVLALVHGEAAPSTSISMHYNRWAWAISYLVLVLALLPALPGRERPWLDGALIGLGMAALALLKMTFFAAFALPVLLALALRRERRALLAALIVGLAVAGVVTLLLGPGFWMAYLGDLLQVARSDVRPQPGSSFIGVLTEPLYRLVSILAILAVVLLRKAGQAELGLLLIVLFPAFAFVTYQNFGNDPQWIYLLALLAFVARPEPGSRHAWGVDLRDGLTAVGIAALAHGAPSLQNMIYSPLLHLRLHEASQPLGPAGSVLADIHALDSRMLALTGTASISTPDFPQLGPPPVEEGAKISDRASVLNGETLPACALATGLTAWLRAVTADLEAAGQSGAGIFVTDTLSPFWMFGDFRPLAQGAPWYYDGAPGLADADLVLVPLCPISVSSRTAALEALAASGTDLAEIRRTSLYILLGKKIP